jgi:hypothetical protein
VNTLHNHVLPWADRPLVNQNLIGGEDGINDAGLSLSRILPAPKGIFLEGVAQVYRGDSDNVFRADKRTDVSAIGHLHLYHDFSESTNLDAGVSYARGHSPFGAGTNQLYGGDFTLRWKPLRRAIYHSFVARSELVWARTTVTPPSLSSPRAATIKPFGYYVSGDYQFGRRWFFRRALRPLAARRLPADQPGDHAMRYADPFHQTLAGYRRLSRADVLAQRIQPDSRSVAAYPLRRRSDCQRTDLPVHFFHGRSRSAHVLEIERTNSDDRLHQTSNPGRGHDRGPGVYFTRRFENQPGDVHAGPRGPRTRSRRR